MQTITTKYLGATNHRGSRIKATTSSGISKTVSYDDELNAIPNHKRAVHKLNEQLNWSGEMVQGSPNDSGDSYIWVFIDGSDRIKLKYKDKFDLKITID
jgi:hypothetical protein